MHRILPTEKTDKMFTRNFRDIKRFEPPAWLHRLIILNLVFAFCFVNLIPWVAKSTPATCERLQASGPILFTDIDQATISFARLTLPQNITVCHSGIKDRFTAQVPDFLPFSGADTCKCTNGSTRENPTISSRQADSLQRPLCFSPAPPAYELCYDPVVSRNKVNPARPPDHLKSLSTIVLII